VVILDGAHNASGARALASTLAEDLAGIGPRAFVVGLLARDPEWFLDGLGLDAADGDRVLACPIDSPRSVDPAVIVAAAESVGVAAEAELDLGVAMASARDMVGSQGMVVVTGSLRLVGAARDLLDLPPT
jgi:dihydrofolate synthase/folylpolyglutamate synthase